MGPAPTYVSDILTVNPFISLRVIFNVIFFIIVFITCAEKCKSRGWYLFKPQLTSLIKRKLWSKNFKRWFGRGRKLLSRAVSSNVTAAKILSLLGFQKTHLWSAFKELNAVMDVWTEDRKTHDEPGCRTKIKATLVNHPGSLLITSLSSTQSS